MNGLEKIWAYPGVKKRQIHPASLSCSTIVMWLEGLGEFVWCRVVECDGIFQVLFYRTN